MLFQGQIPNRIFVGMVENVSFTGQYDKNPYNFKHFNLSSIGIYVNGESLPAHPIKCNFDNNFYLNGYHSLFTTTGKFARDEGLDILRTDYKNGYTLFGFDISPASCNGGHQELIKRGTVKYRDYIEHYVIYYVIYFIVLCMIVYWLIELTCSGSVFLSLYAVCSLTV